MATIQEERFGIEIETTGIVRQAVADAMLKVFIDGHVRARYVGYYNTTEVIDNYGRLWKLMNDGSIIMTNGHRGTEIVSPILNYHDIDLVQRVIRAVREAGARSYAAAGCSIHIHVDGRSHTPKSLANLTKMVFKNEELIYMAVGTTEDRKESPAARMHPEFITEVCKDRKLTKYSLNCHWFNGFTPDPSRYDERRYRGLNLNNLWRDTETIEFRYFNGTLHAGEIKAYIQFCLAISVRAKNAKGGSARRVPIDNPKYNFRVWLISRLGMNGDEFKTARYHLLKNLPGNSSLKNGRQS